MSKKDYFLQTARAYAALALTMKSAYYMQKSRECLLQYRQLKDEERTSTIYIKLVA